MKKSELQFECPTCKKPHLYFTLNDYMKKVTADNIKGLYCCNCGLRIHKVKWVEVKE